MYPLQHVMLSAVLRAKRVALEKASESLIIYPPLSKPQKEKQPHWCKERGGARTRIHVDRCATLLKRAADWPELAQVHERTRSVVERRPKKPGRIFSCARHRGGRSVAFGLPRPSVSRRATAVMGGLRKSGWPVPRARDRLSGTSAACRSGESHRDRVKLAVRDGDERV